MASQPALDRLKAQLLTSGLQERNNSLYQVINQLIDNLRQNIDTVQAQITSIISGTAGAVGPVGPRGPVGFSGIGAEFDEPFESISPSTFLGANFPNPTIYSSTVTGAQNNYQPLLTRYTIIEWNGAGNAAFTGITGGALGYIVKIKNVGINIATFAHNSGSSSLNNVFKNIVTSDVTPIAPGGYITYYCNGSNWQLIEHNQGAWIDVAYAGGNYTGFGGMVWTVDAGDQRTYCYKIDGSSMKVLGYWDTTTIAAPLTAILFVQLPGSYTSPKIVQSMALGFDNGVSTATYNRIGLLSNNQVEIGRSDTANWTASVNNTYIRAFIEFPLT